jgi:enoyl-CoA hydratase/carnithine racemase
VGEHYLDWKGFGYTGSRAFRVGWNLVHWTTSSAAAPVAGRSMGGEEAERWGFFNRLVKPDALQAKA